MDEVKVEVMRSRGAGGQVRNVTLVERLLFEFSALVARQQNRVGCTPDTYTDWNYCVDAGRTESASSKYHPDTLSPSWLIDNIRTVGEHFKCYRHA